MLSMKQGAQIVHYEKDLFYSLLLQKRQTNKQDYFY